MLDGYLFVWSRSASEAAPGLTVENVGIAGLAGSADSTAAVRSMYSLTSPFLAMALMMSTHSSQSTDSLRTTLVFMMEEAISVSIKLFEGTREQASKKKYKGIDRQNRQHFVWLCDSKRDRAHNCPTVSID
jgi:hypothetical protein